MKHADHFLNRTQTADESVDPLTGKAIFALKNKKWKHTRAAMTPIFTTGKMKKMFYLIENCAKELTLHLDRQTVDGKFSWHWQNFNLLHPDQGKGRTFQTSLCI